LKIPCGIKELEKMRFSRGKAPLRMTEGVEEIATSHKTLLAMTEQLKNSNPSNPFSKRGNSFSLAPPEEGNFTRHCETSFFEVVAIS